MNLISPARAGLCVSLSLSLLSGLRAQDRTDIVPENKTRQVQQAIRNGRAQNIILFLGDGMGDSEITIARNYQVGAAGRLQMDSLPLTGAYTTYALNEQNPNLPDYVTDSAASGTGWSTGHKTSNGRISTVAGSTGVAPYTTILELAQQAGFATGDITTADGRRRRRRGETGADRFRQRIPRRPTTAHGFLQNALKGQGDRNVVCPTRLVLQKRAGGHDCC